MKTKSIKVNMVLNGIKGVMSVIFPLISFPYISRVLGIENIGKYNFSESIINYFILLSGLGINTYAIREGAKIRDDKKQIKLFADQMFTINIVSTLFSYLILSILIFLTPKFQPYKVIIIILSSQIIFRTIGIEWIYSVYEDFAYITIRSFIFQSISLVAMFLIVRTSEDIEEYALIVAFSTIGLNLFNYFYARRYCRVCITNKVNWKKHIRPILVLFAMAATVTIYVSSDITILGFLCNDQTVGIYSVSSKIYSIIKTVLSAVLVVAVPRISAMIGNNDKEGFNYIASDVNKTLITVLCPAIIGIIILRQPIVLIVSNETYIHATSSLLLLSIALLFCMEAWFWGQCILIPLHKENTVFIITIVSALINIVLNFILIPFWKENAAAITTIIAECISCVGCYLYGRKYIKLNGFFIITLKVFIGCLGIVIVSWGLKMILKNEVICTIMTIIFSIVIYLIIELILKNETIATLFKKIRASV